MLVLDDITLRVAGKLLLEDASARIPDGARVGLVGRNGTGKTTLFRAIVGEIAPEHGDIVRSPRTRIGRLAQEEQCPTELVVSPLEIGIECDRSFEG